MTSSQENHYLNLKLALKKRFKMSDYFYEENFELKVLKLSDRATIPSKSSFLAAGFDLYSSNEYIIPAGGKCLCFTDIAIQLPHGSYARLAPRSGLTNKFFLDIGAGVIDADYTGNIGIIVFNFGENDYNVKQGEKIAQLIVQKIFYPKIIEVKQINETIRNNRGFGSSDC